MDDVAEGWAPAPVIFGRWTLHGDGRLTGACADIQLPPKEWQVLRLLLASTGVLVTKDHLLERAWSSGEVTEESLTRCIYSLRKHLGDDKGFIKTIYGRGYRFTCPVVAVNAADHVPVPPVVHVCSTCGQVSRWES
ncbi:winged helix-turn-helix domain-containing protein [Pseudomonas fluorescens]|uniref:winged helix-turn-helix domain-containing protein n=1 Tax=Pseudomonas fluorescens TaxID=294 RepID=UPI001BE71B2D|nr:winged helix-turn-helix domain-containing protein [Pseudomonas fluorescens]MBT2373414.1 winged helix-turn-helix domain-containing protein [Pseudomonas fluorescens]